MRIYSAGEAIGPAWDHTKALLFESRPQGRRLARLLKLCFVAIGAQLGFNFNTSFSRGNAKLPASALPIVIFALLGAVFALAVGITLLYLGSRLQFVLFDIVILRDDRVGPAWSRHGHHTWRWAGLKAIAVLAIAAVLSPLLIPVFVGLFSLLHTIGQVTPGSTHINFPALRAMLIVGLEFVGVVLLFSVFYRLFLTVTLPGVALEDLSFTAALRRAAQILGADVSGMLLYAVLQMLVVFTLGIAGILCWAIACGVVGLPFGLGAWALWKLAHASVLGMFLFGTVAGILGVALLVLAIVAYVTLFGTLAVFAEAYGLYFLGGRYPLLGRYLEVEPTPVLGFRE